MPHSSPEERWQGNDAIEGAASDAASAQDAGALDKVVRTTVASIEAEESVTAEELAALGAVAARLGTRPLTLDPVAVELIQAIILANYGHLDRAPEVWRATAINIATLLFDSPAARARLETLWHNLLDAYGPRADA